MSMERIFWRCDVAAQRALSPAQPGAGRARVEWRRRRPGTRTGGTPTLLEGRTRELEAAIDKVRNLRADLMAGQTPTVAN
jgi:hypothetical protein